MKSGGYVIIVLLLFCGCKASKFPVKPLSLPPPVDITSKIIEDSLQINIINKLKAPVSIRIADEAKRLNHLYSSFFPLVLQAEQDTVIKVKLAQQESPELDFKLDLGDPQKKVIYKKIALPVPRNKKVRIIQGHNGSYSHNNPNSRYAIDFDLKVNDTIFAASDGYAVFVVDGYKLGGNDIRYLDFSNRIVMYDPSSGMYFLYSHLVFEGVLVKQGDWVIKGQPIGLVGMTGYTDIPHLHFNVLAPDPSGAGLISVPVDFTEGYRGKDLQKNVIIYRP